MSKASRITGWVLSVLLAIVFAGISAPGKFVVSQENAANMEKMGFTTDLMFKIGIVEVAITILYLIPRTAFIGAILLTGYLGGAIVTHVRVNESIIAHIIIGILIWTALGLRQRGIFQLAVGSTPCAPPSPGTPA